MRVLLDTHIFAWLASGRHALKPAELRAIEDAEGDLFVSVISLWELRLKWRSNPRQAVADRLVTPTDAMPFAAAHGIAVVPFSADVAIRELFPPLAHKDPFDDVLLTHAGLLGAKLLTRDPDCLLHPLAYSA
jgi:PIN domain nuclease of toxin-antitoxin system